MSGPSPGGEPTAPAARPGGEHEPPPVLGTWRRLYGLVVGTLAVEIALLLVLRSCR